MDRSIQFCFIHPSGKDIYLYSLRNINKTEVLISNYGAIIMAYKIYLPDGTCNDIVLGFDNIHEYLNADYLKVYPFMQVILKIDPVQLCTRFNSSNNGLFADNERFF